MFCRFEIKYKNKRKDGGVGRKVREGGGEGSFRFFILFTIFSKANRKNNIFFSFFFRFYIIINLYKHKTLPKGMRGELGRESKRKQQKALR